MKSKRRAAGAPPGMTLVELTMAMLILSIIASVGSGAFLTVLRANRESHDRALAAQDTALMARTLQRDAANLVPVPFGGHDPFVESYDPATGLKVYRILTRLGESELADRESPLAQAAVAQYGIEPNPDGSLRVTYSRQPWGPGGANGEATKGTLIEKTSEFGIAPVFSATSGAGACPSGFQAKVRLGFAAGEKRPLSLFFPAYATPPNNEGKEN
jgi:prepilin-type N-terminal cleavage/methylation domain-containing protein